MMESDEHEPPIIRGRGRPLGARTVVKSVNLKKVAELDLKKTNHLHCKVCNMSFKLLVKFTNHCIKQHFNSFFFQYDCGFCYEVHGSRDDFIKHVLSQTTDLQDSNPVAIVCPLCVLPQGTSSSEEEFCNHLQQHIDPKGGGWVCMLPSCEYFTYDMRDYAKHIIGAHTNQIVPNSICRLCKNPKSENYFQGPTVEPEELNAYVDELDGAEETCPLCGSVLKDCNTLLVSENDVISFEKPKYYRCSICNAGFSTQTKVTKHACRQLRTTSCDQCNLQFSSKKRLIFHLQSHVDPSMTLRCDVCMLTFSDETSCYDHVRFNHESETLCCDTCGKTYITRIGLSMHQMYHDDVRKFKCPECGKRFLNQATLKEHRVSHLNVKPFQCDICGKSLSRASRLRIHLKVHSARNSTNFQKCFACKACGFVSFSREWMVEHNVKVHGESDQEQKTSILHKLYRCEFCDNCYEMPSLLHRHRETHAPDTSEHPFICGRCNGLFKTYSRLVTHKLSHGINTETHILQISASLESADSFIIPQYFCCKYCDKLYEQYTAYNIHMKHSKHFVPKDKLAQLERRIEAPKPKRQLKPKANQSAGKRSMRKRELDVAIENLENMQRDFVPERLQRAPGPMNQHICCKCGKHFQSEKMLQVHENRHNPRRKRKTFACHDCVKLFRSQAELKKHQSVHHRPHMVCENCGKVFRYRGWYALHMANKNCIPKFDDQDEMEDGTEDEMDEEMREVGDDGKDDQEYANEMDGEFENEMEDDFENEINDEFKDGFDGGFKDTMDDGFRDEMDDGMNDPDDMNEPDDMARSPFTDILNRLFMF